MLLKIKIKGWQISFDLKFARQLKLVFELIGISTKLTFNLIFLYEFKSSYSFCSNSQYILYSSGEELKLEEKPLDDESPRKIHIVKASPKNI